MEENKKNNKRLYVIITILVILLISLIGYIGYIKFFNSNTINDNTNNSDNIQKSNYDIKETKRIFDFIDNNMHMVYYDYEKIYNYYFTLPKREKDIFIYDDFDYVKVDNKTLYWKVDDKWIQDSKITEKIKYFDMHISALDSETKFVIVTEKSELYVIDAENACLYCTAYDEDNNYVQLTQELYNKFKYKKIDTNGEITNLNSISYCECSCWPSFYLEMNDEIYQINHDYTNDKYILEKGFYKASSINSYANRCESYIENALTINLDGTINNFKDKKVKYLLYAYKDDDYYNLVIDDNNNLYLVNKEKDDFKLLDKLTSIDIIDDIENSYYTIKIVLSNNEKIELVIKK